MWGIEEFNPNSRRLKSFDFSPRVDGSLRAYPVFTTREAALEFVEVLTEDASGPDVEKLRQMSRECVRQISAREIPRASTVAKLDDRLIVRGDRV